MELISLFGFPLKEGGLSSGLLAVYILRHRPKDAPWGSGNAAPKGPLSLSRSRLKNRPPGG
jgi:hypothetical protein